MSVASSVAVPHAPARRLARSEAQHRLALLFATILVTSVSAVGLSLVSALKPIGAGGDALPDFAALAPLRGYAWAFFTIAGVQMIVGVCAAAVAGLLLVPARGARLATVGGSLIWLGAAIYGVGIGGWASVYYFGADRATLGTAAGTRLIDRFNDDAAHMLAVPIGGALLVSLGGLLLAAALWRAARAPRRVPLPGAPGGVAPPPPAPPG